MILALIGLCASLFICVRAGCGCGPGLWPTRVGGHLAWGHGRRGRRARPVRQRRPGRGPDRPGRAHSEGANVTNAAWETLSNQALPAAGLVYFVALLVHLAEWAALRQPAQKRPSVEARSAGAVDRRRRRDRGRAESAGSSYVGGAGRVPRPARLPAHLHRRRRPPRRPGRPRDGRGPQPGAVGQHVRVHGLGLVRRHAHVPRAPPPVPARVDGADRRRLRGDRADGRR